MDFSFTDEQQQFADALRRYLGEQYGFEARQAIVRSDAGVSDTQWSAFAELGLTALPCRTRRVASAAARSTCWS